MTNLRYGTLAKAMKATARVGENTKPMLVIPLQHGVYSTVERVRSDWLLIHLGKDASLRAANIILMIHGTVTEKIKVK